MSIFEKMSGAERPFFGSVADRFFLFMPFYLIALLALFVKIFDLNFSSFSQRQATSLIIDIFFLGTLHNFLTFWVLLRSPRARQWIHEYGQKNFLTFGGHILMISLALFFVFGIYHGLLVFDQKTIRLPVQLTVDILSRVISTHHSLWQIMGISILMAHQRRRQGNESDQTFAKYGKREKNLFRIFFGVSAISILAIESIKAFHLSQYYSLEKPISLVTTCALFLIGSLMVLNAKCGATWDRTRVIYLLRVFIWALLFWSPYAYFLAAAIHGLEYGFVCRKMVNNDEISGRIQLVSTLIIVLLFGAIFRAGRFEGSVAAAQGASIPVIILALHSLAYVGQYLHTHIDNLMFAMRNKETREFSGYLLSKEVSEHPIGAAHPSLRSAET